MITRLRLQNFRRHAETEIVLGGDDQIVVVEGLNGAGKSTLIEAILFAAYGQGRYGARRLDTLVRRGAEIEGMEVELTFTMGEDEWRIVRRRDGRAVSAVLFGNDQPLVEGTRAVTEAVSELWGLDAAGFRLAVIAQQKELDALVKLGGPSRVRAISRLLHIDAVSKAREEARSTHRRVSDVLAALPNLGAIADADAAVERARAGTSAAEAAENECRAALAELEAGLAALDGIDDAYRDAQAKASAAAGVVGAIEAEVARARSALGALVIPDELPAVSIDLGAIEAQATVVEREIARAEAALEVAAQRGMLEREVAGISERLDAIGGELAGRTGASVVVDADAAAAAVERARGEHHKMSEEANTKRDRAAEARSVAAAARRRFAAVTELEGSCDRCGQEIPEEHRHSQVEDAERDVETATAEEQRSGQAAVDAAAAVATVAAQIEEMVAVATAADAMVVTVASLEGERAELVRRLDVYRDQLGRLRPADVDVDELYAKKGELAVATMEARSAQARADERQAAIARKAELEARLSDAEARLSDAQGLSAEAALSQELVARWDRRNEMLAEHRAELEMLGELTAATAQARGEIATATANADAVRTAATARRDKQEEGTVAALCARVLTGVEARMGETARPSLEGAAGALLAEMSEGRFSAVSLATDFTPRVLDDGHYRQLGELSGGEQDLVALALRLALSEVVADRHGGGVGFLILDEILGSQDATRREAIMSTLRSLRNRYGQIWCISHVGGLEDTADRVIEIEIDDEGIAQAA